MDGPLKPLSGARMELLDGLPTVVGGYDNKQQNDILYQVNNIQGDPSDL